jgi:hypothetical protein
VRSFKSQIKTSWMEEPVLVLALFFIAALDFELKKIAETK